MIQRRLIHPLYERFLASQCLHFPCHIAIIQDGNRRFARSHHMTIPEGHRAGADTTERLLDWAHELGIRHITLYCFSTENFTREEDEVKELVGLFMEKLRKVTTDPRVHSHHIRIRMMGDRSLLPADLLRRVEEVERATEGYGEYFVNLALAYGGRNEIVKATRDILTQVRKGVIRPESIDPSLVERHLDGGKKIPPVDLIIRTGNERRISNFLPWLANGNECAVYFCAPNWPSFRRLDLLRAIRVYDQRMRNSG